MTNDTIGPESDTDRPVVLVIDDEERVCQAFELWIDDEYQVKTATSGSAGLEQMDDRVDVVLLDRHMPGMSGDEVVEHIRAEEYNCRVAMVTAVDPDFDIIDLPFDAYVTKPVDASTLGEVIDQLLSMNKYNTQMAELYAVIQKITTLEMEKGQTQLENSDQYTKLLDRRAKLESELDQIIESLDPAESKKLFSISTNE